MPDVNWKSYMESVERIVRQHSSVYQRTRGRALSKEPTTALSKMVRLSIVCTYNIYIYIILEHFIGEQASVKFIWLNIATVVFW